MNDRILTTFPSREDFEAATIAITEQGQPPEIVEPPASYTWLASPALVLTREARVRLIESAGGRILFSGWVEYRPAVGGGDEAKDAGDPAVDIFGSCAVAVLAPCVADETKIRIIAHLRGDLEPVFPFLNAVMRHASLSPDGQTLTYMSGHRMIVLYPRRIAIAKADEIVDAWRTLASIRRLSNETWAGRGKIEPCHESRKKPPALEVFKRLPGTNCGLCGEPTCMAFAVRLWSGEASVRQCEPVFQPEHEARKEALTEICAGLGIGAD